MLAILLNLSAGKGDRLGRAAMHTNVGSLTQFYDAAAPAYR